MFHDCDSLRSRSVIQAGRAGERVDTRVGHGSLRETASRIANANLPENTPEVFKFRTRVRDFSSAHKACARAAPDKTRHLKRAGHPRSPRPGCAGAYARVSGHVRARAREAGAPPQEQAGNRAWRLVYLLVDKTRPVDFGTGRVRLVIHVPRHSAVFVLVLGVTDSLLGQFLGHDHHWSTRVRVCLSQVTVG